MHKHSLMPSYLRVVTDSDVLTADPPRAVSPLPGVSDDHWLIFTHGDAIRAGAYDYWLLHRGPFLSDAELKAEGLIAADWTAPAEVRAAWAADAPLTSTDSTVRPSAAKNPSRPVLAPPRSLGPS